MPKKETQEEKVQMVTPEQYLHARLNAIETKLDELISLAQEDDEEEED